MKRDEFEAIVRERIRKMRQVTKLIVHAFSYAIYKDIYEKYKERSAELR